MSAIRARFQFAVLILTAVFANSAAAQNSGKVQEFREWAADVIRGEQSESMDSHSGNSNSAGPETLMSRFVSAGKEFLRQVGQIIGERIGWLRPTTVKEMALGWLVLAMALPWGFVIWVRPEMKEEIRENRLLIVTIWTGMTLCTAWYTWGAAFGADRFASTMLIGLPVLLTYFHCVASSIAAARKI